MCFISKKTEAIEARFLSDFEQNFGRQQIVISDPLWGI